MSDKLVTTVCTYAESLGSGPWNQLYTVASAFDKLDAPDDRAMLIRVLKHIIRRPEVADLVADVCTSVRDTAPDVHTYLQMVIRISKKEHLRKALLTRMTQSMTAEFEVQTAEMQTIVDYGIITDPEQCVNAKKGRFKNYHCDVPVIKGNTECGMNANFTCEKGTGLVTCLCTTGGGGKCKLSDEGRQSEIRTMSRTRVKNHTEDARRRFVASLT